MVKMKFLIIAFSLLFPSLVWSGAAGDYTEMLIAVRNIEIGLNEQFLSAEKPLPASLNEIDLLNEIVAREPGSALLFNDMSIVPGAPVIHRAPGIAGHHVNWRLFAIGRTVNTDFKSKISLNGDKMPGRYSVWISPDLKYCAPGWIPETEVQAAFKQIGSYNPSLQHLAFPEAAKKARDKKARERNLKEQVLDDYEKNGKSPSEDPAAKDYESDESISRGFPWLIFIPFAMALFVLLAFILKKLNLKVK